MTTRLQQVFDQAHGLADARASADVAEPHLLLALLREGVAAYVLDELGVPSAAIAAELAREVDPSEAAVPPQSEERAWRASDEAWLAAATLEAARLWPPDHARARVACVETMLLALLAAPTGRLAPYGHRYGECQAFVRRAWGVPA